MIIKTKAYTKKEIEELVPLHLFEQLINKNLIYVYKMRPVRFIVTNDPELTRSFEEREKAIAHLSRDEKIKRLNKYISELKTKKRLPEEVVISEILDTCGLIVWYSSKSTKGSEEEVYKEFDELEHQRRETEEGKFKGYVEVRKTRIVKQKRRPVIKTTYPDEYLHEVSVYHKTPSIWSDIERLDFFKDLIEIALGSLSDIRHGDYERRHVETWHGKPNEPEFEDIIIMREAMQRLSLNYITSESSGEDKACYYVAKYIPLAGGRIRDDGDWEYYKPPGDTPVLSGNVRTTSVIPKGKKVPVIETSHHYADLIRKHLMKK